MASIWRHPESKYYMGCFTAADGRQLKRSTRETNKNRALAIAQAWEQAEGMGRDGYLTTEEQFRRVLTQSFERITGKKLNPEPTVREWLERWLKTEQGAVAFSTHRRYSQVVRDFLTFLGTRTELRLEALTTEDFLAFRDALLSEGRTPQTANLTVRKVLKRPFTMAFNEGIISRNPVAGVRHLIGVRCEKGVFSPEQIVQLLTVAQGDWKGLILVGYFTGGRLSDLAQLRWENIDLVEHAISFRQKKTDAKIRIPIHPELLDYLKTLPRVRTDDSKPLFSTLHHLPGTGRNGLSMAFKRIMERAGIDDGVARERSGQHGHKVSLLSFHSLRHSFTSALANAGVPADIRQKLTGHADAKSHQIYSHHEFATVAKAIQRIARLPHESRAA
jgi:integrase